MSRVAFLFQADYSYIYERYLQKELRPIMLLYLRGNEHSTV